MKITSNNIFIEKFLKYKDKEYVIFDHTCILKGYCASDDIYLYIFKVFNHKRLKYTYKDLKENKMIKNIHPFDLVDTDKIALLTYSEIIYNLEKQKEFNNEI